MDIARHNKIRKAIRNRQVFSFYYDDLTGGRSGFRAVQPYCYGRTQDGIEALIAYEVEQSVKAGWELYYIREMGPITIQVGIFHKIRDDYSNNEIIKIYEEIVIP